MALNNYPSCLQVVWQFDGIKDDEAPGENFVTTYGITAGTWAQAVDEGIIAKPQSDCTPDDAKAILKALYWDKVECDNLPLGVDLMAFNMAMLGGVEPAIRSLQQAIGVEADGIIGPQTRRAVRALTPPALSTIGSQFIFDMRHLRALDNWTEFEDGWTRRENTMSALAHTMATTP